MDKSIITGRFIGLIAVFKANKRFYGRILKDPATNDYPFPLLLQYSSVFSGCNSAVVFILKFYGFWTH